MLYNKMYERLLNAHSVNCISYFVMYTCLMYNCKMTARTWSFRLTVTLGRQCQLVTKHVSTKHSSSLLSLLWLTFSYLEHCKEILYSLCQTMNLNRLLLAVAERVRCKKLIHAGSIEVESNLYITSIMYNRLNRGNLYLV